MDIPIIPMELKKFGLLVAILFFLISLLINLLQRRYSRQRFDRMLTKDATVINFLASMDKYLGKLEHSCTLELYGKSSPQEVGKAIRVARDEIQSTLDDIQEHLRSFRQYRRKEKAREKLKKRLEKSQQRPSG